MRRILKLLNEQLIKNDVKCDDVTQITIKTYMQLIDLKVGIIYINTGSLVAKGY